MAVESRRTLNLQCLLEKIYENCFCHCYWRGGAVDHQPLVRAVRKPEVMNDGTWGVVWMGGYGGIWMPVLLVIAIAGLLAWLFKRDGK